MNTKLEFLNVTKQPDLEGVSFCIQQGEVVGAVNCPFVLRLAAGLVFPEAGEILLNQFDLRRSFSQAMQTVGVVAGAGVYPHLSGMQQLRLAARMYGDIREERIVQVAEQLSLTELLPRRTRKYNQDACWRLALAQALLHQPDLLLIQLPDEQIPLLQELLPLWREEGKTVLLSGSSQVASLCDRILPLGKQVTREQSEQKPAGPIHYFFDVDQPIQALYALEQEFPDVSFAGNLLELNISEEQSERVSEILYQRGIEVLDVTAREV